MSSKNPPKQIIGESKKFSIHGTRLSTVDPDPSIATVPGSLVGHSNAQPSRLNQTRTLSNTSVSIALLCLLCSVFFHIWTLSSLVLQQLFHYSSHFANLNIRIVVKIPSYNQSLFIASIVSFLVTTLSSLLPAIGCSKQWRCVVWPTALRWRPGSHRGPGLPGAGGRDIFEG